MDTQTRQDSSMLEGREGTRRETTVFARPALPEFVEGSFLIRFARDDRDVREVQRLRYEVFNLELHEGLAESHRLGLDRDRFDDVCDHLMVVDRRTQRLIGTYRLQTWRHARQALGFYGDGEFVLDALPESVLHQSIELGRACIESGFRNGHALYAMWRGLAAYAAWSGERYLLGCCSLTSQDPLDGARMHRHLQREGCMHPEFDVPPRPALACRAPEEPAPSGSDAAEPVVPKLFATYLRYGALACGAPALDREFGTIDFLVVLDLDGLDPRVRTLFFSGLPEHRL